MSHRSILIASLTPEMYQRPSDWVRELCTLLEGSLHGVGIIDSADNDTVIFFKNHAGFSVTRTAGEMPSMRLEGQIRVTLECLRVGLPSPYAHIVLFDGERLQTPSYVP